MELRPFWRYYGGKWRAAPRYPAPRHRSIIEPFAGAAGYSLRHHEHDVILVERYPTVAAIWRYLIAAPALEILAIPEVDDVNDLPTWVPQAARWLVGFSMNSAASTPRRTLSAGRLALRAQHRQYEGWTAALRMRVAAQVTQIRHWRVIEGDYTRAPDIEATWFVDAPYIGRAGAHYVHGSRKLDYATLGRWCRSQRGQVIVCEGPSADWLPFRPFRSHGFKGSTAESVWTSDDDLDLGDDK